MADEQWDAVVVGGGPAGLSAALWLARYRRHTLVLDDARPRNESSWAVHGFPGLPDPRPDELRARLRQQAVDAGTRMEGARVATISGSKGNFRIEDEEGRTTQARRVVLAYGRTDRLPDIPGILDFYGRSVFHCPDCDGPSVTGCALGVLGHGSGAAALALYLLTWADHVTLLTDGLEPELEGEAMETLQANRVPVRTEPIRDLEGLDGSLERVRLDGDTLDLDALFFHWGSDPSSALAQRSGCECAPSGDIRVDRRTMETSVEGIHAAGDIVGHPHLTITAAAEGVRAALAIHRSLLPPEFEL